MSIRFAGLDVHKRVVEACILDEKGNILTRERFPLTRERLLAFARETLRPTDHVALEATTNTWAVAEVLSPHVARVVVSNPLKTKAIAQAKVKTDKVDALVLGQLLRCDYLPSVWEPDAATRELRRLTARRSGLVRHATALKNHMHSVLAQRLLVPPMTELFSKTGRAWLAEVTLDEEGRFVLDGDLRLLHAIEQEISRQDDLLAKKAHADEDVRLLMTLPGADFTVAQTVLAALGDVSRFSEADKAAAYLGLAPRTKQSADRCYHGPITKAGNSHARWMLIQAAQHIRLHPGPLGVFFRRLAKKKNHNVAVVAAARKLVLIAWYMLRNREPYRYAQPASTQTKLARLRIRATGRRRKGGLAKGSKCVSRSPQGGRTRTRKALPRVYAEENLPATRQPRPGERRMLRANGLLRHVQALQSDCVIPKPQTQTGNP